jgi:TRAP-type uncharacterized transport system fused permease subunit
MPSKKASLLILAITALACSGVLLHSFDDPEGPNLLIVVVTAIILFFLSLAGYLFDSLSALKRLLLAIAIQILLAAGLYLLLS